MDPLNQKTDQSINPRTNNRRVLIVDDDPNNLTLMRDILEHSKCEIRTASSGAEGLQTMASWKPALVVLDQDMPGMTGLEMLREIRRQYQDVDVMFVSAHSNPMMVSQALELGADDYIRKPFSVVELTSRVHVRFRIRDLREQLKTANDRLAELSVTDDLTGLLNMRSIYEKIEYEIKRAKRSGRGLAVVMFDMDHFKRVNDAHDHLFGSFVLKETGRLLKSLLRETDFAARYGGDEFLAVLTDTDERGAHTFCHRLLELVRGHLFQDKSDKIQLTVSLGYAVCSTQFEYSPQDLVRAADHALYQSKEGGRNQVSGFGAGATAADIMAYHKKQAA